MLDQEYPKPFITFEYSYNKDESRWETLLVYRDEEKDKTYTSALYLRENTVEAALEAAKKHIRAYNDISQRDLVDAWFENAQEELDA